MKGIDEIRRDNLAAESKRLGGDAALAKAIGKDKNQVYQWRKPLGAHKQKRNIRTKTCRDVEPKLGRPEGWLDVDHSQASSRPADALPPGMAESRPKNDVQAIRYALQGMATAIHRTRPDIAEDVAREIVGVAGLEFSGQGFVNILVGLLAGVERTSAEGLRELLRQPVSSKSKRGSARVK